MDQNEDIFVRFMNDAPFQKVVTSWMAEEAYRRLRVDDSTPARPKLRLVDGAPRERYVRCVPLVPLKVAAGTFGDPQQVFVAHWQWVELGTDRPLRSGMFVAQVVGKSMEPAIPASARTACSPPRSQARARAAPYSCSYAAPWTRRPATATP